MDQVVLNSNVKPPVTKIMSNILPRSAATYEKLAHLYQNQSKDFSGMISEIQSVLIQANDRVRETSSNINELMKKTAKEEDVKQKAGKFLDGKNQQLKNKNKNIQSIVSGMKETVSNIKPKQLAKLPIEKERILAKTFQILYAVLYPKEIGNNSAFDWDTFKKKALQNEDGEDFQSRMANINIRGISEQTYSQIMSLKQDPEFNKLSQNQKYSAHLLELGDWMEYVCKGYEFYNQWKGTQSHYQKIQKNVVRRGLESGNAKEALQFWKQAHADNEQFRDYFTDLESRLKTIQMKFQKDAPQLQKAATSHNKKIEEINSS